MAIGPCGAFQPTRPFASTSRRCAPRSSRTGRTGSGRCCVIASAGTVNTGAIDDLPALAALAAEEDLWLHVDGCIGALIAIAPRNAYRVAGIEKADLLALDPHKWLHAPFEAGCALVRDAAAHRSSFAVMTEYLEFAPRGLASGEWLLEWGLQTTRGFPGPQNLDVPQGVHGVPGGAPAPAPVEGAEGGARGFRSRDGDWA